MLDAYLGGGDDELRERRWLSVLRFDGVVAGYGGGDVLKGVDFTVAEGGVTCIVGPNGSGKSTLLKAVSGLLRARSGQIWFKRRRTWWARARKAILAAGIVQVPQNHSLFREMTVEENIDLGGVPACATDGWSPRARPRSRRCSPIVAERARDKAGSLSGGQQRLVEFARCLMLEPELWSCSTSRRWAWTPRRCARCSRPSR